MSEEKTMIQLQAATVAVLHRIATALEAIALTKAPAPNFVRPIGEYAEFDFDAIGAKVAARDQHGPTMLEWGGYQWTRRSPSNKFGSAIWFSRPIGKDETGVRYARLITFREPGEAEPLPGKVAEKVGNGKPAAAPRPEQAHPAEEAQAHAPIYADVAQARAKPKPTPLANDDRKYAHVKSSAWFERAKKLAARVTYYQDKKGQPNLYHLAGAALKCGYQEITDENLSAVLRDLEQHAIEQTTEVTHG